MCDKCDSFFLFFYCSILTITPFTQSHTHTHIHCLLIHHIQIQRDTCIDCIVIKFTIIFECHRMHATAHTHTNKKKKHPTISQKKEEVNIYVRLIRMQSLIFKPHPNSHACIYKCASIQCIVHSIIQKYISKFILLFVLFWLNVLCDVRCSVSVVVIMQIGCRKNY